MTESIRCLNPVCRKRLFDTNNLQVNKEGSLTIKCRCKKKNRLTEHGLELVEDEDEY